MTTIKERPNIGRTLLTTQLETARLKACSAIFATFKAREHYLRTDHSESAKQAWGEAEVKQIEAYAKVTAIREQMKEATQ